MEALMKRAYAIQDFVNSHRRITLTLIVSLLFLNSCLGCPGTPIDLLTLDITPPIVLSSQVIDPTTITITYSENITLKKNPLVVDNSLTVHKYNINNTLLTVEFQEEMIPGKSYHIEVVAYDTHHNSLHGVLPFYGFNNNPPKLLITEFTVEGNGKTRPETVEIFVLSDGNLAGVTVESSKYQNHQRYIFPQLTVEKGEFILLHYRSTGDTTEIDEDSRKDSSQAPNTHPEAWDLWITNRQPQLYEDPISEGLSPSNGALSIHTTPGGSIIDAVIFSKGTSSSYSGFGSEQVYAHAINIMEQGAWVLGETGTDQIASGNPLEPKAMEVAISTKGSTTTRSIARINKDNLWKNTESPADWYITPTGGVSFGEPNILPIQ